MKIHAVLVRTENPANIGTAVRAAANMGGDRLILIDPRCEVNSKTRGLAAGAAAKVDEIVVYRGWEEFYAREGEGLRIALSRRGGRNRKVTPLKQQLQEAREIMVQTQNTPGNLYLIFGPEADGLDSSDLSFANHVCHLPVFGAFGSLNLAQAVMLAFYIAREIFPPDVLPAQVTDPNDEPVQPFYFPDDLIKQWLEAMGFDVQARRSSAYLTLRRLFLQNQPTRHEIQVLEAVLQQNIRKLNSLRFGAEELADDIGDVPV